MILGLCLIIRIVFFLFWIFFNKLLSRWIFLGCNFVFGLLKIYIILVKLLVNCFIIFICCDFFLDKFEVLCVNVI